MRTVIAACLIAVLLFAVGCPSKKTETPAPKADTTITAPPPTTDSGAVVTDTAKKAGTPETPKEPAKTPETPKEPAKTPSTGKPPRTGR